MITVQSSDLLCFKTYCDSLPSPALASSRCLCHEVDRGGRYCHPLHRGIITEKQPAFISSCLTQVLSKMKRFSH